MMETTGLPDALPASRTADPLAGLRERLREDVPRIAAEAGCGEAAILALFSRRIARAIPEAASPAIATGLARLRAEIDAQVCARRGD